MSIIPLARRLRQLAFASALLGTAGCAGLMDKAFAPAPNPWPIPKESRVRRDGRLLRVYGASLKNRADAEKDARTAFEAWLWSLDVAGGDDLPARKALIDGVVAEMKPVPAPVAEISGYTSIIEIDLPHLQQKLGTHYE